MKTKEDLFNKLKGKKTFGASRLWRGSLCLKDEMVNPKVIKVLSVRTPRPTESHNHLPRPMPDSMREGDIFSADQSMTFYCR